MPKSFHFHKSLRVGVTNTAMQSVIIAIHESVKYLLRLLLGLKSTLPADNFFNN
ncbi:MAG: hypothetical protein WCK32_08400 [Chlorobiaceae bacterium]